MPVMMVTASSKLLSQVVFIAAGIVCLQIGEQTIGHALIFGALGSLVPVAEKAGDTPAKKETP